MRFDEMTVSAMSVAPSPTSPATPNPITKRIIAYEVGSLTKPIMRTKAPLGTFVSGV